MLKGRRVKMHEVVERLNSVREFQLTPAANVALQRAKEEAYVALAALDAIEKAFIGALVDQAQIITYEFVMSGEDADSPTSTEGEAMAAQLDEMNAIMGPIYKKRWGREE